MVTRKSQLKMHNNNLTFSKNRNIICFERVADLRKSSFAIRSFYFIYNNVMKKCVACQRKSNLCGKLHFFCGKGGFS